MDNVATKRRNHRPTIIDVARTARVGVMTVSRVINNYSTVKASTRAKVMNAIEKVGYRPNDAARMLKGMRARMIGLMLPDLSDFFSSCFHAVQAVAIAHDYQTMVVATGRSVEIENQQLELIADGRIAGLLIVSSGGDGRRVRTLQEAGIPVVALDRPVPGLKADVVLTENRDGAEIAVRHLLEHGHKSIACVGFDPAAFTVHERMEGYRQVIRAANLKIQVYDNIESVEAAERLAAKWAKSTERPSAVFATQRLSAVRLIQGAHRQGLRIPKDLAVIGFDDFELADALATPLTVVSQLPEALARSAAELLFTQIEQAQEISPSQHQPAKIVFPARLIIRSSCGCKPANGRR